MNNLGLIYGLGRPVNDDVVAPTEKADHDATYMSVVGEPVQVDYLEHHA